MYRVCNLPESMANDTSNSHVTALASSEYWNLDASSNRLQRVVRKPKSLHPILTIIVDDLYQAYKDGVLIRDHSIPSGIGAPTHFRCHVCLLTCLADYPAMGDMSMMKHKGRRMCHWCNLYCPWEACINRNIASGHMAMLGG